MADKKSTDDSSQPENEDNADVTDVGSKDGITVEDTDATVETPEDVSDEIDTDAVDDTADVAAESDVEVEISDDDAPIKEDLDGTDLTTDEVEPEDIAEDATDLADTPDVNDELVDSEVSLEPTDADEVADEAALETTDDTVELSEPEDVDDTHITEEQAEQLIDEAETVEVPPEPAPTPVEKPAPEVIRETVVEHKAGFMPTLLGGVVAAGLGYFGAAYVSQNVWPFAAPAEEDTFRTDVQAALDAQSGSLSEIVDRVTSLEGVEIPIVDLSPLESGLSSVQETTGGIASRLDELSARLETLEKAPIEETVSPAAIAAYEKALDDLRLEIDAQRVEVETMVQGAIEAEDNAEEQAQLAAARAALADLTSAVETGDAYEEAVAALSDSGVTVPEALSAYAADGIPTQGALIESFPEAARAALSAARTEATEGAEGTNRVATFFANQLGARSVAPKEGDGADAVLSRAEAAVRGGDLETALSEISALPEVAQGAIAEWQSSASTRLEAKTAADALVQQLLQE